MPLSTPQYDVKRELARKIFDSLIAQVPVVGAPAVALYSVTHPPKSELIIQKWRHELTDKVNSLEQALTELTTTVEISNEASALAISMSERCVYGHGHEFFALAEVVSAMAPRTESEVIELCGELSYLGLVRNSSALGAELIGIAPKIEMFEIFDSFVFPNRDVRGDAGILAAFVAENKNLDSRAYVASTGWPVRRYNPAMATMCKLIGGGRISRIVDQEYFSLACFSTPEERAALRRFASAEDNRLRR